MYPQTKDGTDSTPIEWLVLDYDAEKNRALLISRYGLELKPYNTRETSITWEKCSLRTWLNQLFITKAFDISEQAAILLTKVDNSSIQGYNKWSASGGKTTQDKIFLLSLAEANKYFDVTIDNDYNKKARIHETDYATQQDPDPYISDYLTEDGMDATVWWLRSPGFEQERAAFVNCAGSFGAEFVSRKDVAVRPAFWLDLNADIF